MLSKMTEEKRMAKKDERGSSPVLLTVIILLTLSSGVFLLKNLYVSQAARQYNEVKTNELTSKSDYLLESLKITARKRLEDIYNSELIEAQNCWRQRSSGALPVFDTNDVSRPVYSGVCTNESNPTSLLGNINRWIEIKERDVNDYVNMIFGNAPSTETRLTPSVSLEVANIATTSQNLVFYTVAITLFIRDENRMLSKGYTYLQLSSRQSDVVVYTPELPSPTPSPSESPSPVPSPSPSGTPCIGIYVQSPNPPDGPTHDPTNPSGMILNVCAPPDTTH